MFEEMTVEKIHNDILSRLDEGFGRIEGGYTWDLTATVAMELAKIYAYVNTLRSAMFPTADSGEWLEKRCADYGIERKPGVCAELDVTITSETAISLPAGTMLRADDSPTAFQTLSEAVLTEAGSVSVRVRAVEPGRIAIGVNALALDPPVPGVRIEHLIAVAGAAEESDEELFRRLRLRLTEPPAGGTAADYMRWALEIPGVAYAKVRYVSGVIRIMILDRDGATVTQDALAKVQENIERKRPLGSVVQVIRPTSQFMKVSAEALLDSDYTIDMVKEAFRKALQKYYLDSEMFASSAPRDEISLATVTHILMQIPGVLDASKVSLDGKDSFTCSTDNFITPVITLTEKGAG